jgi:hypothetical protein
MNSETTELAATLEDYMLPCLNREFLGVECPGCGLQRAFTLLLQGDFAGAFYMYPAIYTLILLFGFLLAGQYIRLRYANTINILLMISSVVLILVNFIMKFF